MTPTELLTNYETQVLSAVKQGQDAVVQGVKTWAEAGKGLVPAELPAMPAMPGLDMLPAPQDVINNAFAFLDKLLAAQREFATAVLSAAKPVLVK
jgi:hypothetical protein